MTVADAQNGNEFRLARRTSDGTVARIGTFDDGTGNLVRLLTAGHDADIELVTPPAGS